MNAPLQHRLLEDAPIEELRRQITQPTMLLVHMTAGRSILTVRSHKSGERYTLRFRRPDAEQNRPRPIWLTMLGGPEEDRNWAFLGTIWPVEGRPWTFNRSLKSKVPESDRVFRVARWISGHLALQIDSLMEEADWWHEGRCGRCGRRLTVPESIESGFGPECIKSVGLK